MRGKNYSSYDKELYVVVQALKKWKYYMMPKEFVLYYDNHALQFINSQPKLNKKHSKWVECLHKFTLWSTSGKSNKVDDALSRVNLIFLEIKASSLVFESLINMYKEDVDFKDIYVAHENPVTQYKPMVGLLVKRRIISKK